MDATSVDFMSSHQSIQETRPGLVMLNDLIKKEKRWFSGLVTLGRSGNNSFGKAAAVLKTYCRKDNPFDIPGWLWLALGFLLIGEGKDVLNHIGVLKIGDECAVFGVGMNMLDAFRGIFHTMTKVPELVEKRNTLSETEKKFSLSKLPGMESIIDESLKTSSKDMWQVPAAVDVEGKNVFVLEEFVKENMPLLVIDQNTGPTLQNDSLQKMEHLFRPAFAGLDTEDSRPDQNGFKPLREVLSVALKKVTMIYETRGWTAFDKEIMKSDGSNVENIERNLLDIVDVRGVMIARAVAEAVAGRVDDWFQKDEENKAERDAKQLKEKSWHRARAYLEKRWKAFRESGLVKHFKKSIFSRFRAPRQTKRAACLEKLC